jgi:hypothetical protein
MAYSNEYPNRVMEERGAASTASVPVVEYHDRVRWGPILAGIAIALSLQLILSALGTAIGATGIAASGAPRTNAGTVGTAIGIWSVISLLISLFLGGFIASRASGPLNKGTALLNGSILWASTLIIGAFLVSSGVSGAFGLVASNAGEIINQAQQGGANLPADTPNISAQQARDIASNISKVSGYFSLGSLFGLIAALIGSSVGNTRHKTISTNAVAERRV